MKRCPFPKKVKHTRQHAHDAVRALGGGRRLPGGVHAYRCPAGDHWHVGHTPRRNRKRKQW